MTNIDADLESQPPQPEGSRFAKAHHILLLFLAAAIVIWLLSGIYTVKSDEIAIVERLGQYVSTPDGKAIQVEHGLQYHLPWPIDIVHKISVQQTATLRVNAFDTSPSENVDFKTMLQREGVPTEALSALFDPYLITADKSVIHMDISVIYRINDPEAWLNTISHTGDAAEGGEDMRADIFQQIAQHAMITQIAHMTLEEALFTKLPELPGDMLSTLQDAMNLPDPEHPGARQGLGVQIQKVEIVQARPPESVKSAFDQVIQAKAGLDTAKSQAEAESNATVTRAQGQVNTLQVDAQTYKKQTTEAARGEADRFNEIMVQFRNAPDVTRWNVFVDAVRSVSGNAKRMVFAQPGQKTILTVDPPQYDPNQVQPSGASGQGQPRQ